MTTPANKPKPPSVLARDALRRWVRAHPRWDRTDPAQNPATLPLTALHQLVRQLGGDPATIVQSQDAPMPLDNTATLDAPAGASSATPSTPDTQLESLRDKLVEGGFGAVRQELRKIIEAAQRPPVVVEKIVERVVHAPPPLPPGAHDLKPVRASTWGALFGLQGTSYARRPITVWDHPSAPKSNAAYIFPEPESAVVLSQLARSEAARAKGGNAKHVLLYGPAGTGKSAWPREFAARTGRPFVTIPCSDGTEVDVLMGQTVLEAGQTKWQDGILLAAIRQPGMVICLDEVGGMRPAVGVALNGLLQDMVYYVPDTGERVAVARGVVFVATNNSNLLDGGAAKGYVGIGRQNRAFADRFGASVEIGYAPEATEIALLQTYTDCTPALAKILVDAATLSRAKAQTDDLTHGIGFRRLVAWAECLMDGIDVELAFRSCVLNTAPEADVETLRQLALVAINPRTIRAAIKRNVVVPTESEGPPAPSNDFDA